MLSDIIHHILVRVTKAKNRGFGGLDYKITNIEFAPQIKVILRLLGFLKIRYWGDEEEGRTRLYNFNGAFVGHYISFNWNN
jgi:hypothetical protein